MARWTASGWSCGRHPHHDHVATLRDRGCSMSKTLYIVVEHVPIAELKLGRGPKHRPGSNGCPVPMLKNSGPCGSPSSTNRHVVHAALAFAGVSANDPGSSQGSSRQLLQCLRRRISKGARARRAVRRLQTRGSAPQWVPRLLSILLSGLRSYLPASAAAIRLCFRAPLQLRRFCAYQRVCPGCSASTLVCSCGSFSRSKSLERPESGS